jgi:hypothetical protein
MTPIRRPVGLKVTAVPGTAATTPSHHSQVPAVRTATATRANV